jgi:hypothetical protein
MERQRERERHKDREREIKREKERERGAKLRPIQYYPVFSGTAHLVFLATNPSSTPT